jgi:V8-like Glu-specific endopeptidase
MGVSGMIKKLLLCVLVLTIGAPGIGGAQRREVVSSGVQADHEYWTSNRLRRAREMPLPRVSRSRMSTLFGEDQGGTPENMISLPNRVLQFSSSRLIPRSARTAFPYSTLGRLFFKSVDGNFVCSASVISNRVVLTAGHCVYDASRHRFHEKFVFVPGYYQGQTPRGVWTARVAVVPEEWKLSGDVLPNAADFGVLVLNDNEGSSIGQAAGWLGFRTQALVPNHVHLLGFPVNHDGGEELHQVTSGDSLCCFDGTAVYGSDMGPGSSGGPLIQNFGQRAIGQSSANGEANRVVGVISYGPVESYAKFEGSSILNQSFLAIFENACSRAPGNCLNRGTHQRPRQ